MAPPTKATSAAAASTATTEKRSTVKLDTVRDIEQQMQKLWADLKVFEADAPVQSADKLDFLLSLLHVIELSIFLFALVPILSWSRSHIHI